MQTRNDYDVVWEKSDGTVGTGVFNGDVGRIQDIDPSGEFITLLFDDREAVYTTEMLTHLDLAYAQTIHKAQGSEYRCVVLSAWNGSQYLLNRSVLYTAITRARELFIVVGDDGTVAQMVANNRQTRRYSALGVRLVHES